MAVQLPVGVRSGSTALLLPSRSDDDVDTACVRLLAGDEPRHRNVVALTVDRSAEGFLDTWFGQVGVKPADINIVDVGTDSRSTSAESTSPTRNQNVIRTVEDPRDLETIWVHLEELLTVPIAADETRLFYLDALPAESGATKPEAAFSFLESIGDLVRRSGCAGFVRVDPNAHSHHSISIMTYLVDVALGLDDESGGGGWTIRARNHAVEGLEDGDSATSLDTLFKLLADRRRRLVIHFLGEAGEPMSATDLATRLAAVDVVGNEPPRDKAFQRIYTGLIHVHLPKLAYHGLVSVDGDGDLVRLRTSAANVDPFLALTVPNDLHG